jgi:hypothetical protein
LIRRFGESNILDRPRLFKIQHFFIKLIGVQLSLPCVWLERPYFPAFSEDSYSQQICVRHKRRPRLWITKSRNGLSVHS